MKRFLSALMLSAGASFLLTSCIKDELPNIEVDVLEVSAPGNEKGITKTTIQENGVTLLVDEDYVDVKNLKLEFKVSDGATYSYVGVPAGEVITDYSVTRKIHVVSEDKQWEKDWTINVLAPSTQTYFSFDNWYNPDNTRYMVPFEYCGDTQLDVWATTNSSMSLIWNYVNPEHTYQYYGSQPTDYTAVDDGGKALLLKTTDITLFDQNRPFVSGCMFLGEFDGADTDPLNGTHFGQPFKKKPLRFKGYYSYVPGILASGKKDTGLIEAVLFRKSSDTPYLTGYTIKNKSYKDIVAYAEINPNENTNGYKAFDLEFTYNQQMKDGESYQLALYFASSKDGDVYVGSGDTMMMIDNVEIVCE